ncbi:MAG: hypothetical protein KDH94_01360 [Coxiellaceae bacterium]|nr:hypothetical protein [Coxiellaceae bacterium]
MYRVLTYSEMKKLPNQGLTELLFSPVGEADASKWILYRDAYSGNHIRFNQKVFESTKDQVGQEEDRFLAFLDQQISKPENRALLRAAYQQKLLYVYHHPIYSALTESGQIAAWIEAYNREHSEPSLMTLKPEGDRVFDVYENSQGRLCLDIQLSNMKLEGLCDGGRHATDIVYRKLPGRAFFHYEFLPKKGVYLKSLAVDNDVLYRLYTEKSVRLTEEELRAGQEEADSAFNLEHALVNTIYDLEKYARSITKSDPKSAQIIYSASVELNKKAERLVKVLRTDIGEAERIVVSLQRDMRSLADNPAFLTHPKALNVLVHCAIALTGIGGLIMLGVGLRRLATEKEFDPRLFKPQIRDLQRVMRVTKFLSPDDTPEPPQKRPSSSNYSRGEILARVGAYAHSRSPSPSPEGSPRTTMKRTDKLTPPMPRSGF